MAHKDDTAPATKADIAALRETIEQRFTNVRERQSIHHRQFQVVVEMLSSLQTGLERVERDVQAIADKLLGDYERRLVACDRRLGLAV